MRIVDYKVAENITFLRLKKNWTQKQLANHLNMSRSVISKWESGIVTPDLKAMIALSEIFKTSLDQLVGLTIPNEEMLKEFQRVYASEQNQNFTNEEFTQLVDYLMKHQHFTKQLLKLSQLPIRKQRFVYSLFDKLTTDIEKI